MVCPSNKTWLAIVALLVAMLALSTGPAGAQRMEGTFWLELGGTQSNWDNSLTAGGGTGSTPQGQWLRYDAETGSPQTAMTDAQGVVELVPRFWNQWYYDGVLDLTRWKIIDISFNAFPVDPALPSYGVVYLNWSTALYPVGTGGPPITDFGPNGEQWIGRDPVWEFPVPPEGVHFSKTGYRLPIPYNPEWVSVDVRGYNVSIANGVLIHDCVPEPTGIITLLCGLSGVSGLMWRRRR